MIVPRVRTPVPLADLPDLLDAAHRDVRGFSISDDAYNLAVAQLKLEHGTDGQGNLRAVWNFNLANHDATASDHADPSVPLFSTVPEHEEDAHGRGYQAVHTRRAYEDAEAGLVGYWTALLDGFPAAYDALEDGPEAFAAALKRERYYTASEQSYARALRALLPP